MSAVLDAVSNIIHMILSGSLVGPHKHTAVNGGPIQTDTTIQFRNALQKMFDTDSQVLNPNLNADLWRGQRYYVQTTTPTKANRGDLWFNGVSLYEFSGTAWITSSGGGAVSSVFGRTGAVVARSGDYTPTQVGFSQYPIGTSDIAAGTSGYLLQSISGSVSWQSPSVIGGGAATIPELIIQAESLTLTQNFNVYGNLNLAGGVGTNIAYGQNRVDAGTFSRFWIYVETNTAAFSTTCTLNVNGADQALQITVPTGQTGVFTDDIHTVNTNQNDLVCLHLTTGSGSGTFQVASLNIDFSGTPTNIIQIVTPNGSGPSGSILYSNAAGATAWLPIGSQNDMELRVQSGLPAWKNQPFAHSLMLMGA